jgi:LPS export ABC transporter protein LptC
VKLNLIQISVCCMLVALLSFCCEEKIKPSVSKTFYSENYPSQESWNSRIVFSQDGKVGAIITAGHISAFDETKETYLDDGVRVEFFNEQSKRTSVLTSKRARVNDISRDLEADENVIVVSDSDKTTLRSEKLFWSNSRQLIYTHVYVEIDAPNEKIQGIGLESDRGLKHYKVFQVTGRVENVK